VKLKFAYSGLLVSLLLPNAVSAQFSPGARSGEFSLDLRGFSGVTVTIDGVAAGLTRQGDKLIITPAEGIVDNRVFHAVVNYSGPPAAIQDPDGSIEGWARIAGGGFLVNEPMGAWVQHRAVYRARQTSRARALRVRGFPPGKARRVFPAMALRSWQTDLDPNDIFPGVDAAFDHPVDRRG
jgi:hypothetical protein